MAAQPPKTERPKPPDPEDPWFRVLQGIEGRLATIDAEVRRIGSNAHEADDDFEVDEANIIRAKTQAGLAHNITTCVKWAQKKADRALESTYAKVIAGAVVATAVPLIPKAIMALIGLLGG